VREFLYEVLRMGVALIDYSHSSVIVAKRVYRRRGIERFWGSVADLEEVLRRLEARLYYVVVECKGVEFEKGMWTGASGTWRSDDATSRITP